MYVDTPSLHGIPYMLFDVPLGALSRLGCRGKMRELPAQRIQKYAANIYKPCIAIHGLPIACDMWWHAAWNHDKSKVYCNIIVSYCNDNMIYHIYHIPSASWHACRIEFQIDNPLRQTAWPSKEQRHAGILIEIVVTSCCYLSGATAAPYTGPPNSSQSRPRIGRPHGTWLTGRRLLEVETWFPCKGSSTFSQYRYVSRTRTSRCK